jgi:lipopolysaccharide transport system ATP-binding protein
LIEVKHLTKDYIGFSGPLDRILTSISFGYLGGKIRYRALDDINFTCQKGEILGIIGRNGAGKSTLLKILTGVSSPTTGFVKSLGQIRSILELGVGFNPELTGEENVYYNGLVWGFSLKEIHTVIDKVFEFANLQEFKNTPIKNYSSGMVMRLGFALATATTPEVLIVDEALAVGDAVFQQKSIEKFQEFKNHGTSILIVSHDLTLLSQICDRILVIEKGKLVYDGNPILAVQEYMKWIADTSWKNSIEDKGSEYLPVEFQWKFLKGSQINPNIVFVGETVVWEVEFSIHQAIPQLTIGIHIDHANGVRVYGTNTFQNGFLMNDLKVLKKYKIRFEFPLLLGVGKYSIGMSIHEGDSHTSDCYFWGEGMHSFEVERVNLPKFTGLIYFPIQISMSSVDLTE